DVVAIGAVAVLAHAVAAALGLEVLLVAIVDQGIEAVDRLDDDVAAAAAIAAVRTAELDELLTPERHAAIAAVAGLHINLGLVEEFHRRSRIAVRRLYSGTRNGFTDLLANAVEPGRHRPDAARHLRICPQRRARQMAGGDLFGRPIASAAL